jgi:hypothetical protein
VDVQGNSPGNSREPARRSVLRAMGAAGVGAAVSPLLSAAANAGQVTGSAATAPAAITIDWDNVARISKTTPTLQVVVNPLIQRSSPIHGNVFSELRALQADYVRFVPWFPYPLLGVAELEPPANGKTSWDFSLIDPIVADFERATRGHSRILNFSTTPEWMWQPPLWDIRDGELYAGGGIGLASAGSSWTDYTFSVTATPLQTGQIGSVSYAQAGLAFRFDSAGSGYVFLLSNYPYTSPAAPGYVTFVKYTNGSTGSVQATPLPFAVTGGQSYQVTIDVSGAAFTISVNGTHAATVTDASYPNGTVGFREDQADSESALFGDVTVTAPDGTVLLADDFADGLSQWIPPTYPSPPTDPSAIDFGYSQGTQLAVPVQTVADYYRRVVSWYTAGGFTDEYGRLHSSGHHYSLPYWEVLNEMEHGLSPQSYTQLYDAIVTAIREVSPDTRFVGLALANPGDLEYFTYFLNPANHQPGVPLDMISYHFYAQPGANDTPQDYGPDSFPQADNFIATVASIEAIRKQLAPRVRTTVDETGTILPSAATQGTPAPIPDAYWNYSGCIYAYVFANLALQGIDVVGESQLVGYPGQFPSVSMVDWTTGLPNARYRVLQLLLREMRPGWGLVPLASGAAPSVFYGLGLVSHGLRKLLLVNKTDGDVPIQMAGLAGATARVVDQTSGGGPIRTEMLTGNEYVLPAYGVAVITLAP